MTILTRNMLIDKLREAATTASSGEQAPAESAASQPIATWAFDQFYAEEAGAVTFEPGYRRVIGATLDDLMFSDQPGFALSMAEIERMISALEQAAPTLDEADDDDDDDEDDDADDSELE